MSSKQKIAISAIGIVMVLAIIGLTIGLVLVAQQAQVTNSMVVTYTVKDVSVDITSSAMHYANASAEGVALIMDGEADKTSHTDQFTIVTPDSDPDDGVNPTKAVRTHSFEELTGDKELEAEGYVTYTFAIKNTASVGGKVAKVSLAYIDTIDTESTEPNAAKADTNIKASVRIDTLSNEEGAQLVQGEANDYELTDLNNVVVETLNPQHTVYINITVSIADYTLDAEFTAGLSVLAELAATNA